MSETSAKLGVFNRRCLAVFWGLFGMGSILVTFSEWFRETHLLPYSAVVGACFVLSSLGFYRGDKWGRIAIGILVAPLVLLCFDRLMGLHFQRYYGAYFWVCLVLVAAGFYTWVFIFTGLDRDASRVLYNEDDVL